MKNLYAFLFSVVSLASFGQQISLDQTYSSNGQANIDPVTDNMSFYMYLRDILSLTQDQTLSLHLYTDANTYLPSTEVRSQIVNGNAIDESIYFNWNSSNGDIESYSMDQISDGIILAGRIINNNQSTEMELVKLDGSQTSSGSLDNSFGTNGTLVISDFDFYPRPVKVLEKSDGSLFLISEVSISGNQNKKIGVTKITAAGVVDNTFGTNGHLTHVVGDSMFSVNDALIDANDNIYIGGGLFRYGTYNTGEGPGTFTSKRAFVARLLPDGSLDNTYSGYGYQSFSYGLAMYTSTILNLDFFSNGDVMVCGNFQVPINSNTVANQCGFARLTTTGAMETSFGPNGTGTLTSKFNGDRAYNEDAVVVNNDVILALGGMRESSNDPQLPAIYVLDGNGSLITDHHPDGYYLYANEFEYMTRMAKTSEGKILTYGEQYDQGGMLTETSTYRFIYDEPANLAQNNIEITVFPNPATDILSINSSLAIDHISIIGMDGSLVGSYTNTTSIPVDKIAPGTYILNVLLSSGEMGRRKIIIE